MKCKNSMKETTLCYITRDNSYLMLYRNKKSDDVNEGKWIGVGGKLEEGETPDACICREVREETGLTLTSYRRRGVIYFYADGWESEVIYLYSADGFAGELTQECNEGELRWIPISEIMDLNLWEGDRIFLRQLVEGREDICLTVCYEGDKLVSWKDENETEGTGRNTVG